MENRKRNVQIIVRVTEEEWALIEEKMKQIPTINLSAYSRKMLIDGYIIIATLIVKDMSRLGRDYLRVGLYTDVLFPEKGVRFIAISNGVDSEQQQENDFTPFLNIINEWYCRDTSKQIFALCLESYGPSQIARILKEDKVITPTIHFQRTGRATSNTPPDEDRKDQSVLRLFPILSWGQ